MILVLFLLACLLHGFTPETVEAFPDNGVLDTFTGTDDTSPPNANWTNTVIFGTTSSLVRIRSNAVTSNAASGTEADAYYDVTTFDVDQEVYADIIEASVHDYISVCGRLVNLGGSTTDGYCVYTDRALSQVGILRVDNGAPTQLGSLISQAIGVGDKVGLKMVGSQICAWFYDASGAAVWTELGCRTDATYSVGGYIGLAVDSVNNTTGIADNFGGGNVAAASALFGPLRRR